MGCLFAKSFIYTGTYLYVYIGRIHGFPLHTRKVFMYCIFLYDERSGSVRVKVEDGIVMRRKEAVKGVWKRHFECMMSETARGEAVVICLGMNAEGGRQQCRDR